VDLPAISIIILNYNGKKYLRDCIDSVLRQDEQNFEIIFVDNGSSDGSVGFIEARYAARIAEGRIRVIANDRNHGFAEGNNIGYRVARGKYIVLLNNDVIASRNWLRELISPLVKYKDICLTGSAYYDKGTYRFWKQVFITNNAGTAATLTGESVGVKRTSCHEPHLAQAFYVSGNGVAMRKKEFVQPFDSDYVVYAEDTYLGWLAQLEGKAVVLDLKAIMVHIGGGTTKANKSRSFSAFTAFHNQKNHLLNHLIFYEWKNVIRVYPLLLISQAAQLVTSPRKILPTAKAYWWILRNLRRVMRKRKEIQSRRKVPEGEIIRRMSCKFLDETYAAHYHRSKAAKLMNRIALAYCFIVRLQVRELQKR
jgi:GT2 family glycosyltransferase